ncbi:tetraacyldisaccharide 4'-kinase [Flavobacterium sp. Sd200]|uniref:tetraacyldisaccharide 4'-kinase n=1 Tax=Flavobacterium sp. Sd200 TaxID=2692211 RepID=UPI00136FF9C0|nr:tetraacyldisaccharide 4'-kinase [Flavobacterium sp. Sd200]MXN91571.1 tetraacyldisaccharide 4'-kinase [Flavobacterium sp. Sd200]
MRFLRKFLLPFSLLYWLVMLVRNLLYNTGVFKSYTFKLPVIAVGNLSTGGTGKTPQTEYLIRLLSDRYKTATLSRGYKRKSEGFVLAEANVTADILGDEPYQFYSKFPHITVAVDANRKNGIEQLQRLVPGLQVVLLDDAYQHRRVKAGFYILLTPYNDLYANDYVLPAGNLREGRSGAARAAVIVVTKCPPNLSETQQKAVVNKLKPKKGQSVYFTAIGYDDHVFSETGKISMQQLKDKPKVVIAGIARPKPFFDHVANATDVCRAYPDHHDFTDAEVAELIALSKDKIIVTTEKDYVRLKGKLPTDKLFFLSIKTVFLNDGDEFDRSVLHYVEANIFA